MTDSLIDHTHDAATTSWVVSANGHEDFPIQNLPFGVFAPPSGEPRGGVAIGDMILDLRALTAAGLIEGEAATAAAKSQLNGLLGLPAQARRALRHRLFELLESGSAHAAQIEGMLWRGEDCHMHLPVVIGDYTDFYAGINHAENVGRLFRPDNPLMPNYKYVPIGYHGRASSIRVSGQEFHRPHGQLKGPDDSVPTYRPVERLDYELELGIWVGEGNELGHPIPITEASAHIAGLSLLNDWSARDIQTWEYQPLGPFLAKNFASTLSPWIVTAEALAPYRTAQPARAAGDPEPLPYLYDDGDQKTGAYAIDIEVGIETPHMRAAGTGPERVGRTAARNLYWTLAQLVTHHTSNGCNLRPGDLLGTGTISAKDREGYGSLLEITGGGREPFTFGNGEKRTFLEDGDSVVMTGKARAEGRVTIGFGECRATLLAAIG